MTRSNRYKAPRSFSFTMKNVKGKSNMFNKYGISKGIDPKLYLSYNMVELSKYHVFWKRSLVALLLDWGPISVKGIFLTIISKYIQKIWSLYIGIKAQWAIEKRHKKKNIGAKLYVQSFIKLLNHMKFRLSDLENI